MMRNGIRWKPWALVVVFLVLDIVITLQIAGAGLRPFSWKTLGTVSLYDVASTGATAIRIYAQGLEPGRDYVLQGNRTLLSNTWNQVGHARTAVANTSARATNSLTFRDAYATGTQLFYRVVELP
jgi:hypothetical protein